MRAMGSTANSLAEATDCKGPEEERNNGEVVYEPLPGGRLLNPSCQRAVSLSVIGRDELGIKVGLMRRSIIGPRLRDGFPWGTVAWSESELCTNFEVF